MNEALLIAIVGRPNVGKSTLFNVLTRTRLAIVADKEGVTRDRRIHSVRPAELDGREIRLMDTGGWMPESWRKNREDAVILRGIETQILAGLAESVVVLLVVDVRAGLTVLDEEIARFLRKQGRDFIVLANKTDTSQQEENLADFRKLGGKALLPISAEHRRGINELWDTISEYLPEVESGEADLVPDPVPVTDSRQAISELPFDKRPIRLAIVGRPNVGKSSFLNALLGEERAVESPIPGTTTDAVDTTIERNGQRFTVIDTAGIRRHAKRVDDVENLSVMSAKRNLEKVDLAFLVLDAADGVTAQDAKIAALVRESGAAAIVIANKWDLAPERLRSGGKEALKEFVESAHESIPFLDYAPTLAISAKEKQVYSAVPGVDSPNARPLRLKSELGALWLLVQELATARNIDVPTADLNALLQANAAGGPNIAKTVGRVFFAHRVPVKSPVFCAYVHNAKKVPDAYRRYLARTVRDVYGFRGNPIRWIFRSRRELKAHKDSLAEYRAYRAEESQSQ